VQTVLVEVVVFWLELAPLQLIVPSGRKAVLIAELAGLLFAWRKVGSGGRYRRLRCDSGAGCAVRYIVIAGVVTLLVRASIVVPDPLRSCDIVAYGIPASISLALRVSRSVGLRVGLAVLFVLITLLPKQRGSCAADYQGRS
jgi:hypothetical protein